MEPAFDPTVFTKNRQRLLDHDVAGCFRAVVERAQASRLMSSEHFTVDVMLIEAGVLLKSFKKRDGRKDDPPPPPADPATRRSTSTATGAATPPCLDDRPRRQAGSQGRR